MKKFNWLLLMAWRDSRRNVGRLMLFMASFVVGIAALVAINSFSISLLRNIDEEAKTLLGADLQLRHAQPISDSIRLAFDSLSVAKAEEVSFASMIVFAKSGGTRLVEVRAIEGDYPFYGKNQTMPEQAATNFWKADRQALVDQTVMLQFGAQVGDTVRIGELSFVISAQLIKVAGQSSVMGAVAPVVFIAKRYLSQTNLVQVGSRLTYRYHYKATDTEAINQKIKYLEKSINREGLTTDTVATRKKSIGRAFDNLGRFLNLTAFIALLLGCLGVASAVHIYIKGKLASVAVLRCMGASGRDAFLIYLIQISLMGLIGSLVGALVGSLVQVALPLILKDFLPVEGTFYLSYQAIGQGILTGLVVSVLFGLLPLLSVRRVSPLRTLRSAFEEENGQDWLQWLVYLLISGFILGFAFLQMQSWKDAAIFTVGIGLSFALLAGAAWALIRLTKRFFPTQWSYLWRQGLANLFRPNNQTLILVVSVGLGCALITTLYFIQGVLLSQVTLASREHQPDLILLDIQRNQVEQVKSLLAETQMPVIEQVPIVTMRLVYVNGKSKVAFEKNQEKAIPDWAFSREYRVTYRDNLTDAEQTVGGKWRGQIAQNDSIYVSFDERTAESMSLKIGDELTFNVQGMLIKTYIGHLRQVDFTRLQTNFILLFPKGVLEEAPQFYVMMTKAGSQAKSAAFQAQLIRRFPTVSAIDISLVLDTVQELLDKVAFVIRFMAMFSICTGLLVLVSSLIISKFQRIRESVLLRTIGASRRQILMIASVEYFFLGMLAALTGILLAFGASWLLSHYVFHLPYLPYWTPALVAFGAITGLTVSIGLLNSGSLLNRSPLEVLRNDI